MKRILKQLGMNKTGKSKELLDYIFFNLNKIKNKTEDENIEYYLYEMDCNTGHCYYENDKPVLFGSALEFIEWIKKL